MSVAELKCSISVRNVLEAEVRDSALLFPPLGGALVLGSRQQRICWRTLEHFNWFQILIHGKQLRLLEYFIVSSKVRSYLYCHSTRLEGLVRLCDYKNIHLSCNERARIQPLPWYSYENTRKFLKTNFIIVCQNLIWPLH